MSFPVELMRVNLDLAQRTSHTLILIYHTDRHTLSVNHWFIDRRLLWMFCSSYFVFWCEAAGNQISAGLRSGAWSPADLHCFIWWVTLGKSTSGCFTSRKDDEDVFWITKVNQTLEAVCSQFGLQPCSGCGVRLN